jgi:muramoyltetrapeptide carboxypeptidase
MPQDVLRDGGEAAVDRALDWLVRATRRARAGLDGPAFAFNLTVLSSLLGTRWSPTSRAPTC